jgi:hypothetical protein
VIALLISYTGYCFFTTTEMINKTSDRLGISPP